MSSTALMLMWFLQSCVILVRLFWHLEKLTKKSVRFLAANDTDRFNRWEAGQILYTSLMLQTLEGEQSEKTLDYVSEVFERTQTGKMDDSTPSKRLI